MTLKTRLIGGGFAGLVLLAALHQGCDAAKHARESKERERIAKVALETTTRELDGAIGREVAEKIINATLRKENKKLSDFVAAIKKADPGAKVDTYSRTTVAIEDRPTGVVIRPPEVVNAEWRDDYHRFRYELPNGPFHRKQLFKLEAVFIRSADGKVRVSQSEFWEFDPETRAVIPSTGVDLKGEFQFFEEKAEHKQVPIFHLRALAGVDHRLAPGVGVELLNLERTKKAFFEKATLSLMGFYDRKTSEGRGVAMLGYRLLNTNFVVGPYFGISTNGTTVVGAGAALQVTR